MRELKKYQVWLGGSELFGHVYETSETAAMQTARVLIYAALKCTRVPADTGVCEISETYYADLTACSAPLEG